jgi:hypothetical protein
VKGCSCRGGAGVSRLDFKQLVAYVRAAEQHLVGYHSNLKVDADTTETRLVTCHSTGLTGVAMSTDSWKSAHFYFETGSAVASYTVSLNPQNDYSAEVSILFHHPSPQRVVWQVNLGRFGGVTTRLVEKPLDDGPEPFNCDLGCLQQYAPQCRFCASDWPCWCECIGACVAECCSW